jgi:peptidoglycan/xylan/chitin deacetylase (PgdA/CDA1 family)
MRKKSILRAAFSGFGITSVRWWLLPSGLYCFNFHRIGDPTATEYSRNVFSCSAERFDQLVGFLKSRFELIGLERLAGVSGDERVPRKPLGLITFDDGYVDNYSLAFPILRRHSVPAVFFLPTGFVGGGPLPWWEEIPWILRQSLGKVIRFRGSEQPFELSPSDPERSLRRVMMFVKSRRTPAQEQVEEVREACGGVRTPAEQPGSRLFVSWDEVREMQAAGMDFGSHTHTHRLLGHLNRQEQVEELATSKEILEGQLARSVTAIAYPVGSETSFTQETREIASSLGYRLGFNFLRHNNPLPLPEPFSIGRLAVSENLDPWRLRSVICFPRLFAN